MTLRRACDYRYKKTVEIITSFAGFSAKYFSACVKPCLLDLIPSLSGWEKRTNRTYLVCLSETTEAKEYQWFWSITVLGYAYLLRLDYADVA